MSPVVSDEMRGVIRHVCFDNHCSSMEILCFSVFFFFFSTCTVLVVWKNRIVKTHWRILGLPFFPPLFLMLSIRMSLGLKRKWSWARAEDGDESELVSSESRRKKELIRAGKWEWARGSAKPSFSHICPLMTWVLPSQPLKGCSLRLPKRCAKQTHCSHFRGWRWSAGGGFGKGSPAHVKDV